MKNHSCNLHAPFCGTFVPNSVVVARYDALIRDKFPTNYDAHLAESIFQTCSRACPQNHSRNLHAPLCGIFCPNSVAVARYGNLIRDKFPTNCDAHFAESIWRAHSKKGPVILQVPKDKAYSQIYKNHLTYYNLQYNSQKAAAFLLDALHVHRRLQ